MFVSSTTLHAVASVVLPVILLLIVAVAFLSHTVHGLLVDVAAQKESMEGLTQKIKFHWSMIASHDDARVKTSTRMDVLEHGLIKQEARMENLESELDQFKEERASSYRTSDHVGEDLRNVSNSVSEISSTLFGVSHTLRMTANRFQGLPVDQGVDDELEDLVGCDDCLEAINRELSELAMEADEYGEPGEADGIIC